jgi:hypothetical protein
MSAETLKNTEGHPDILRLRKVKSKANSLAAGARECRQAATLLGRRHICKEAPVEKAVQNAIIRNRGIAGAITGFMKN